MRRAWLLPFILIILLAVVASLVMFLGGRETDTSIPFSPDQNEETTDFPRISVFAQNLDIPWSLDFLPNGDILFTERAGRVRLIENGELMESPVATVNEVEHIGEGGLLGIALHPEFENNNYVYLYYTYSEENGNTLNRVERYIFENGGLREDRVIVEAIPGASNHNGGRIKFGPDWFLYIGTGDAQEPSLAQNTDSLAGKILRVAGDGGVPEDNPFGNLVYSYGHRNVQGLAWDDQSRLWATEHGRSGIQSGLDELNLIEEGQNYGWPEIEGNETQEGMSSPILNSGASDTWAPSGAAFANGSIFFSGLRGQALYEYDISERELRAHFKNELGRIRDVVLGPNGMLYVLTSNTDGRGNPREGDDKFYIVNPEKL